MVPAEAETEQRPLEAAGAMVFIPGGTFRMGSDHHYPTSHVGFRCVMRVSS